ncbi:transcriptional regulator [Rhodococcus sp. 27YEA15]|uniref:FMN-binding negative transcriptional regulator n=1 Tax=Rhodococcus sp. 27YEA15 TaxID=3156259 RepID=UPI003C7D9181
MWVNPLFHRDRTAALDFVGRNPFATIVGSTPIQAAHLPVLLDDLNDPRYLIGHVPLVDPIVEQFRRGARVLAVFGGPAGYVSPAVMTGTALPTYNFVAVHVTGSAEAIDDEEFLLDHLHALTRAAEAAKSYEPQCAWSIRGAAAERAESLLEHIAAFRIEIDTVDAKFKLGQDKSVDDRSRIQHALAGSQNANDRAVAALMSANSRRCATPETRTVRTTESSAHPAVAD